MGISGRCSAKRCSRLAILKKPRVLGEHYGRITSLGSQGGFCELPSRYGRLPLMVYVFTWHGYDSCESAMFQSGYPTWFCQNSYWTWPSRNRWFSHEKLPFSIANCNKLPEGKLIRWFTACPMDLHGAGRCTKIYLRNVTPFTGTQYIYHTWSNISHENKLIPPYCLGMFNCYIWWHRWVYMGIWGFPKYPKSPWVSILYWVMVIHDLDDLGYSYDQLVRHIVHKPYELYSFFFMKTNGHKLFGSSNQKKNIKPTLGILFIYHYIPMIYIYIIIYIYIYHGYIYIYIFVYIYIAYTDTQPR